jgi:aryl-alcohol dehydrogenase-like predicted oxidoreductase
VDTLRLGSTDLRVSGLGLGTVELGMPYGIGKPSPPDVATCIRLLHEARDAGVTYFDTAAAYGRSEELVGRAFPGARDTVLATKVDLRDEGGRSLPAQGLSAAITDSVECSCGHFGVDTIDVLQLHSLDETGDLSAALLDAMGEQVEAGRVRYWGVSTYGQQAPRRVLARREAIDVLQVAYSVLDRSLEADVLPLCRDLQIGLVVRSVFLQGVLSHRRRQLPDHTAPLRQAADAAARVAEGVGIELPELALRFALYESGAHVTLVGTAAPEELQSNLKAANAGPLPEEAVAELRRIEIEDEHLLNPGTWISSTHPPPPHLEEEEA